MQFSDTYQQVELYISCRNLRDTDIFGKNDPKVRVFIKNDQKQFTVLGETEVLRETLNPDFQKTIKVDFIFETQQPMRFEVWDCDKFSSHDFVGSAETTLGDIMGARKQILELNLSAPGKASTGKIIIRGDKTGITKNEIRWQWQGVNLMNTDGLFGKSDPFLRFFKEKTPRDWLQVHQTEFIMDNLNPVWQPFKISDDKLCSGNHTKPIRVECWDYEKSGKHQFIGSCEITLDLLKTGQNQFPLANPKKSKVGTLNLIEFSLDEKYTFLDFITGGEQLNAVVAIDFTASNGKPDTPNSLHAISAGRLNEYQQAIHSVCQIILSYAHDQKVPVYGFGCKPQFPQLRSNQVSHCFPCSGDPKRPVVDGLAGIMEVYSYALKNVEFLGPTQFVPIITEALKFCKINQEKDLDIYSILLILTDGEIHDMEETIELIIEAAYLPISIVIIGIGNENFKKMEILDDKGLRSSSGKKVARDFVQFIPFRNFKQDVDQLTRHILGEIPDQLIAYKALVGRKPKSPVS